MSTFTSERTEHAGEVIAAAMSLADSPAGNAEAAARNEAHLITALHAFLIHERWAHGLVKPDIAPGEALDAATVKFERLKDVAIHLGDSIQGQWDGWTYPWEQYAWSLIRRCESIYTYRHTAEVSR